MYILVKFLKMDYKIDVLRKKKQVKIGDDITQLNQGLLNRLHGDRHKCDIYESISQKLGQ